MRRKSSRTPVETFDGTGTPPTREAVKRMGEQYDPGVAVASDAKGRQRVTQATARRVTVYDRVLPHLTAAEADMAEALRRGWSAIERSSGQGSAASWGMGKRDRNTGKPRGLATGFADFDAIAETQDILKRTPALMRELLMQAVMCPEGVNASTIGALLMDMTDVDAATKSNRSLGVAVGAARMALCYCLNARHDLRAAKAAKVMAARAEHDRQTRAARNRPAPGVNA